MKAPKRLTVKSSEAEVVAYVQKYARYHKSAPEYARYSVAFPEEFAGEALFSNDTRDLVEKALDRLAQLDGGEVTVAEAAKLILNMKTGKRGVTRFRVNQMIGKGKLAARLVGRHYQIRRSALAALDERSGGRPSKPKGDQQQP